jgi:hypothetical protein
MSFGPRLVRCVLTMLIKGIEYQAVVEYAPVQKTPLATKAKQDARQGTIDDGEQS